MYGKVKYIQIAEYELVWSQGQFKSNQMCLAYWDQWSIHHAWNN